MSDLVALRTAPQQTRGWYQGLLDSATGLGQAAVSEGTVQALLGQDPKLQMLLKTKLGKGLGAVPGVNAHSAMRFASNPLTKRALRFVPGMAAAGGVLGAGDVLFGGDSLANKAMDTAGMAAGAWGGLKGAAAGAAAGSVIPVIGTAGGAIIGGLAGAGLGKAASDSLQWLFGDKKTAEQRRMEEALIALKGGVI